MIAILRTLFALLFTWQGALFSGVVLFFTELPLLALSGILKAIAAVLGTMSLPSFFGDGLGSFLSFIPNDALYFLSRSGLTESFAILGTAVLFRLTRKLLTLGRW